MGAFNIAFQRMVPRVFLAYLEVFVDHSTVEV